MCNGERSNLNLQDVRGAEIKVTDLDGTWLRNSFKILFCKSDEGDGLGDLRIDGMTLNKW
jgi:hypothetical protein